MEALSDDEFDHVADFDISEPESEPESADHSTPLTAPRDSKTIPCPYPNCEKTFNREARLKEHIRSHTNERPFVCVELGCKKAFLRDTHLKHHIKSAHTNVRDYECNWEGCGKSFATGTRLRRHLAAHEGREKFRCRDYPPCNETFRKHETLKKHILSVHQHIKPFACEHLDSKTGRRCSNSFETTDKLKSHQRTTHDPTRFSCSECLIKHAPNGIEQLDSIPPQLVDFYFSTFSDLQDHMAAVHPPTCSLCPTSFHTAKELRRHLELQHGIFDKEQSQSKVLSCTFAGCNRTFTKKGNLNVHIKTVHEKKRDFVCGETAVPIPEEMQDNVIVESHGCGRSFSSKATLEEHIRTSHFDLPSKRTQRKKRKAEKRSEDVDDEVVLKKRKPRKDRGIMKTSALSGLTGLSTHELSLPQAPGPKELAMRPECVQADTPIKHEDSEDEDDWNQLSGSMTIMGDHLYHNGQGYQYVQASEQGSTHSSHHTAQSQAALDQSDQGSYIPCSTDGSKDLPMPDVETEPFFDFEHEQELLRSVLDPALFQYQHQTV